MLDNRHEKYRLVATAAVVCIFISIAASNTHADFIKVKDEVASVEKSIKFEMETFEDSQPKTDCFPDLDSLAQQLSLETTYENQGSPLVAHSSILPDENDWKSVPEPSLPFGAIAIAAMLWFSTRRKRPRPLSNRVAT